MWHVGGGEVNSGFWLGSLKERGHLEKLGVDVKILLRWIMKSCTRREWTGLIWLRIGKSVRM
jgi:hypothetical protein